MGELHRRVEEIEWDNNARGLIQALYQEFGGIPGDDQNEKLDRDIILKGGLNQFGPDPSDEDRERFRNLDKTISASAVLERARIAKNPFTKALFLDYRHQLLAKTSERKNSGIAAAKAYENAILYYSGKSDPDDYWMTVMDCVWRARKCYVGNQESLDSLVSSILIYLEKIPEYRGLRVVRLLSIAFSRGLKKGNASSTKLEDVLSAFQYRISEFKKDVYLLAESLIPLIKIVSPSEVQEYHRELTTLMTDAALSSVLSGDSVRATAELQEAARRARSQAAELMPVIMKAQKFIQPLLQREMISRIVTHEATELSFLDPLVEKMINSPDSNHALMHLAAFSGLMPKKTDIEQKAASVQRTILEEIIGVLPIDQHGPSNISVAELNVIQCMDISLYRLWLILRQGMFGRTDLGHIFSIAQLADFLHDSRVVSNSQHLVLRTGLNAWREGRSIEAAFILLPLVENSVVECCSFLGHSSLVLSRKESTSRVTGDTVVNQVREVLGEDWAFFYKNLWAREGAMRHAFCHGYLLDEQINGREADLAVYALISLSYHTTTKIAHDSKVRQLALEAWKARGEPLGDDWTDWFEAERKL